MKRLEIDLEKYKEAIRNKNPFNLILIPGVGPLILAGWLLLSLLDNQGKISDSDAKNVETIIRAGNDNNVDELKIIINKENVAGLDLKLGKLKLNRSLNITIGARGGTKYYIKVKYKNSASPSTVLTKSV